MNWQRGHRSTRGARLLADRHYSRQKIGSPQFIAPGSPLVLVHGDPIDACWVTLRQKFIDHAWPDSWGNVFFRNESPILSSLLIREALAATRAIFGEPPSEGIITFVDAQRVLLWSMTYRYRRQIADKFLVLIAREFNAAHARGEAVAS